MATDRDAEQRFVNVLRAAHLVAAADGIERDEQLALAELVAQSTDRAADHEQIANWLASFDAELKTHGRAATIAALAAAIPDFMARQEALTFAALVALADQRFATREARVLIELGEGLGFSVGEIQTLVAQVTAAVRESLLTTPGTSP